MAPVYMGYFPAPLFLCQWDPEDSSTDAELLGFLTDFWEPYYEGGMGPAGGGYAYRDFTIDRTSGVKITMRRYNRDKNSGVWTPSSTTDELVIDSFEVKYVAPWSSSGNGAYGGPVMVDARGMWESDQFGRPYDTSKLQGGQVND